MPQLVKPKKTKLILLCNFTIITTGPIKRPMMSKTNGEIGKGSGPTDNFVGAFNDRYN